MRLNEVRYDTGQPVDSYGPGFFRIGGAVHGGPLLILPVTGLTPWTGLADPAPLLAAADRIDVLFIGMGADIAPLDRALRTALETAGIGVEVMATPPACRTDNVLLAEGRRIGAALLPV